MEALNQLFPGAPIPGGLAGFDRGTLAALAIHGRAGVSPSVHAACTKI